MLLNTIALDEMMKSKIQACIERREIRDVFDIEFLYKRGIALPEGKKDYTVKPESIISSELRKYYNQENFKILKLAIKEKLS
ncbi:MAG: hypothetical protein N2748_04685 [candidate division WOR-3 bacterium]|nr:hypothetical protein [candidate division WOR-3 bacterium]